MRFGPLLTAEGVRFRLWAPNVAQVHLRLAHGDRRAMTATGDGWFALDAADAGPGTDYMFVLEDGAQIPDPASRWQPQGVHGVSRIVDGDAYTWGDADWRGRPWHEAVLYEMHFGAFTPQGSYRGAIERLDHLAVLGVTLIELMPLADFPGNRGWSYDGVCLFAPANCYGTPDDLRAFVDAAHQRGLGVILDVIYNHFGPEGAYATRIAPLLSRRHEGEFGIPFNVDGDEAAPVRQFLLENVLYWLEDFHLDGYRFDAAHDIPDDSGHHILAELTEAVRARDWGRPIHLVMENSLNQAHWLARDDAGTPRWFVAQWCDDIHHAMHILATGEKLGFYRDYDGDPSELGLTLAEGYAFQGQKPMLEGDTKGEPSAHLPPTAFIAFCQNHDQIGNRPRGDRLTEVVPREVIEALATIVLLSPHVPLLFMGEEWGARTPFPYFSDLSETLREGMRRDRLRQLEGWRDEGRLGEALDPFDPATFAAAKLDWSEAESGPGGAMLDFHTRLLALRHREIVPRLAGIGGHAGRHAVSEEGLVTVRWTLGDGAALVMAINLSPEPVRRHGDSAARVLWTTGTASADTLDAWSVEVAIAPEQFA
jgi:malto-oligosyltrehalose trehalohydrolase